MYGKVSVNFPVPLMYSFCQKLSASVKEQFD